jgi:hypothetical protein
MRTLPRRSLQSAALSLALIGMLAVRAGAEVQSSGTADNVLLRLKSATITEVLSELSSAFNFKIKLRGTTARQFTGTYAGSLRQVLSRLLAGEDFIIASTADGISLVILPPHGGVRAVAGGPPEPVNSVQGWESAASAQRSATATSPAAPPRAGGTQQDTQPVLLAAADTEPTNTEQGWLGAATVVGARDPAAQPAAPAPTNAPAATPQGGDADGNSDVQGWNGAIVYPSAPSQPVKQTPSAIPNAASASNHSGDDEGNPNFQGYMPGWTPPEDGKSMVSSMPGSMPNSMPGSMPLPLTMPPPGKALGPGGQ